MSSFAPGVLPANEHRGRSHAPRRRIGRRGLAVVLVAAAAIGAFAAGAVTAQAHSRYVMAGVSVRAVQRVVHVPADGVYGPQTKRAVKRWQARHGLEVDGVVGPQTAAAMGLLPHRSASHRLSPSVRRELHKIALCESGGNPRAVSPSGRYRGKYQFDRATWRALGGHGDPAAASARTQDRLAAKLLRERGPSAWPSCG